jgi:class 3 adenylate cyclase
MLDAVSKANTSSRFSERFDESEGMEREDDIYPSFQPEPDDYAKREAKTAVFIRALFLIVLILSATLVAVATHRYTSFQEQQSFESKVRIRFDSTWLYIYITVACLNPNFLIVRHAPQFNDFANQIAAVVQLNARNAINAYEKWSLQISSTAIATNQTWPYVTLPHFEAQAQYSMQHIGARVVGLIPIVRDARAWGNYSAKHSKQWIEESFDEYDNPTVNGSEVDIVPFIHHQSLPPTPAQKPVVGNIYLPLWQVAPIAENYVSINIDTLKFTFVPRVFEQMVFSDYPVISEFIVPTLDAPPESFMAAPVYDNVFGPNKHNKRIVAVLFAALPWTNHFVNLITPGVGGILVVVRNPCVDSFTCQVNGPSVEFIGLGDLHDHQYDALELVLDFDVFTNVQKCVNTVHVYPTRQFENNYVTNKPSVYTLAAVCIFALTTFFFLLYDAFNQRWRRKVEIAARRNGAIVHSLFPPTVRERLMEENSEVEDKSFRNDEPSLLTRIPDLLPDLRALTGLLPDLRHLNPMRLLEEITNLTIREQRQEEQPNHQQVEDIPIADLFPSATVMFGDICGFTAWSSQREPAQVFTLLERIYNAFDKVAKRRNVFKVETIGDCYMAATGLPEVRDDHAVIMAGFARECLVTMNEVVRGLETKLGPDTADLAMRFGIHSGPVTAGVLRGEKSRFQLFGDTVNTASRMESTGERHRIQLSQETAELLIAAGKKSWTKPREDLVEAKGKGRLQTFWLAVGSARSSTNIKTTAGSRRISFEPARRTSTTEDDWDGSLRYLPTEADVARTVNEKLERMIDWNVDVLQGLLKRVIAIRGDTAIGVEAPKLVYAETAGKTVMNEVKDFMTMATKQLSKGRVVPSLVTINPEVLSQLRDFVTAIAFLYPENPFHSFEHASHVTQSVTKLLSRIVKPIKAEKGVPETTLESSYASLFHNYTYDMASDPFTQFAVTFSALIHDVEHPGVPNAQLVAENSEVANRYNGRSVSEQNSVDVAWNLLMESSYSDLRACIYTNQAELDRFRQIMVNTVLATDTSDMELTDRRKQRWAKHFQSAELSSDTSDFNRKATIVVECLIQASDVSHTMQHWQIYMKWNERLFHECYHAYKTGRAAKDPTDGWYEGELSFFDYYVLPLVRKLKQIEVFGLTTDEYVTYAQANRKEWETKGRDLVSKYLESYKESEIPSDDVVVTS